MIDRLLSIETLLLILFVYSIAPYVVLWLAVRCWPNEHPRREELLAEYDAVIWWKRPMWVSDVSIRSIFDGTGARRKAKMAARMPREISSPVLNARLIDLGSVHLTHTREDHLIATLQTRELVIDWGPKSLGGVHCDPRDEQE